VLEVQPDTLTWQIDAATKAGRDHSLTTWVGNIRTYGILAAHTSEADRRAAGWKLHARFVALHPSSYWLDEPFFRHRTHSTPMLRFAEDHNLIP